MSTFTERYDETIEELESKLSQLIDNGSEFDYEMEGQVLKIEFENGEKYIISPNSPVNQLWISADYAGHRFNWSDAISDWVNEKSDEPMRAYLSKALSEKLGEAVSL